MPLACKWTVQAQLSRQSWLLRTYFSENSLRKIMGVFHKKINQNCVYLLYTSLNSGPFPPEKVCRWFYLLKLRKSQNQNHKLSLLWKTLCLIFSACPCWCQNPAMPQLFISQWPRVSADSQWTLAAGKMGLFSGHQCELCSVPHPAKPSSATHRIFERGP